MHWQISLILWYVACTGQALWQRTYAQKSELPATFPPALSYALAVTPLGIMVGLSSSHHVHWSTWLMLLLLTEGALIGIFNWLMFTAIRRLPVATFQLIFQLNALVTIILGWILLHETLNMPQILGGVLLLAAAALATQTPTAGKTAELKSHHTKAVTLTAVAALLLGIGLVTEKAALRHMDIGAYFIFGFGTQTLALIVLATKDLNRTVLATVRRRDIKRSIIMGSLSALNGFFYIYSIQHANNITLITALGAFSLPLIVLSSFFFLHERENTKLLFTAAGLGCLGLVISAL